jgi:hypothetical protein
MTISPLYRLVLHPLDIRYASSSWAPTIEVLQGAGFLGKPWSKTIERRYLAGDQFLNYITFMGCSPYIAFEPPPDGSLDFCHVRFSEIYAEPRFRCASSNVFARCPQCSKRIHHWEAAISSWREDPASSTLRCDKCGAEVSVYLLGWRHTAGFSRMFMDIYSVFPQEGVPNEALLDLLEKASGVRWGYFYTDDSDTDS